MWTKHLVGLVANWWLLNDIGDHGKVQRVGRERSKVETMLWRGAGGDDRTSGQWIAPAAL